MQVIYPKEEVIIENGFIFSSDRKSIYFVPLDIEGEYVISNDVTRIEDKAFHSCANLSNVVIPSSVNYFGKSAFSGCSNLKVNKLIIKPETEIGDYAFEKCAIENLVCLCNTNSYAFSGMNGNLYVLNKFYSRYNFGKKYPIIPIETESTNSTIKINKCISNFSEVSTPSSFEIKGTSYNYNGKNLLISGLSSGKDYSISFPILLDGEKYTDEISVHTKDISINIIPLEVRPTSFVLSCEYELGDAIEEIVDEYYWYYGKKIGNSIIGLQPSADYYIEYVLCLSDGRKKSGNRVVSTPSIKIKTLLPKCPTNSTAIVTAETNISDKEISAGFQWKKYDAPSSLQPSEGFAIVYDGLLEGQIKNLQSTSYYNVRAFYKASTGKYYYGDWVTFDPSDFSYLDPSVRTYENPLINENSVTLTGSILGGTDEIISQGFQYWTRSSDNIFTVFTNGQLMEASISDISSGDISVH